jgi:hypothetical protein
MRAPDLVRVRGGWLVKEEAGWRLEVRPLLQLFRLVEVPADSPMEVGRFWCYATFEAAVLAAAAWSVAADSQPVGWVRSGGARLSAP